MSNTEYYYLDSIQYEENDVLQALLDKESNPGKVIDDLNLLEFAFQQYDEHFEDSDVYFQNIELLLNKGGTITNLLIQFSKQIEDNHRLFDLLIRFQNKAISRNISEVVTMMGTNTPNNQRQLLPFGLSKKIYAFLKIV